MVEGVTLQVHRATDAARSMRATDVRKTVDRRRYIEQDDIQTLVQIMVGNYRCKDIHAPTQRDVQLCLQLSRDNPGKSQDSVLYYSVKYYQEYKGAGGAIVLQLYGMGCLKATLDMKCHN